MRIARTFGLVALIVIAAAPAVAPVLVERGRNQVTHQSIPVSDRAKEIHRGLFVADLHADTALWNRDLLARGTRGHVDVPRLVDGGVALQAFTIVTSTPRSMNIERNTGETDNITLLAMVELWPPRTWRNLTERALYQARRITDAAERSAGKLTVLRASADFDAFERHRATDHGAVATFIGVEGAHALGGNLANLDRLFASGVRMMSP